MVTSLQFRISVICSLLNNRGTPGSVNARASAYNARGRAKHTGRERGSTEDVRGIIGGNRGCRGKRGTKGGEEETRGKGDKNLKAISESDSRSVSCLNQHCDWMDGRWHPPIWLPSSRERRVGACLSRFSD